MREIKFRAWDNENNQMLDVQNLDFEDCFYGGEIQIRTTMYNDYFDIREMPLMQYTGLHDKNGKEIYEGDIFNLGDNRILYIVEWFDTGLSGRQNGNSSRVGLQYWKDKIEVIGNIYENKDLLEVKDEQNR